MKPSAGQGLFGILFHQQKLILERNLRRDPLKGRSAERVDVTESILVEVLALPDMRVTVRVQSAQPRDVNIETGVDVDPARIDNIISLSMPTLATPRIHVKQIMSSHGATGGIVWNNRLIVVFGQVGKGSVWNLCVNVPVPRENLESVNKSARSILQSEM